MYTAINYWVLGGFDGNKGPDAAIKDAASWGMDGVELTVGDCLPIDITQEECKRIRKLADEAGIGLRTLATGFYWGCSLGSPDEAERKQALAFTRSYLQIAAWIGVESILVVPGAVDVAWEPDRPVVPYQQVWDCATASLKELLPLAESLHINIALENVWNKFLLSPIEMKIFVDQFESDHLGVYFDTGNCLVNAYPEHWLDVLGPRVKAVHVKNYSREMAGGTLSGFGDDLLQGDLDLEALLAAIKRNGLEAHPFTAEMIPFSRLPEMVLPDPLLAQDTAEKLKHLFS
ncbi:sugar phosphate isomerase/epimerase [Kiritimatiellota bacterium B12222]|nr:sugar phosphate isomerase/epimerase [Kiritimatiellota bacterium B12222]